MNDGDFIAIQLLNVKEPPYSVMGLYRGTTQLNERGEVYVKVETANRDIVHVRESLIHVFNTKATYE